jgi:peptide/nickel transport system substrate-binding protein
MMDNIGSSKVSLLRKIIIGLTLMIVLTSCGGEPTSPPPTVEPTQAATEAPAEAAATRGQGGTLTLLYFQAPTIVNPHLSVGDKDLEASRITYEPLANFDKNGNMVPLLAAEIPTIDNGQLASDGTSVTWKLNQDVKWADGESFTANDVLFTYQYITNPDVKATSASAYAEIDKVEVLDDYTVKITFKKPTTSWFAPFVSQLGMIIPRHIFEDYNGANAAEAPANLKAIGTGPYYVSEFRNEDVLIIGGNVVTTNKIIYEINPYYRDTNKPFFSKVELSGGGDLDTAVEAGKEGLVDFVWNIAVSEEKLVDVESAGKALAVVAPSSFVERIMFNFSDPNMETEDGERSNEQFPHPILSDLAVRQAIAMAINREAIAAPYGRGGTLTTNILAEPPTYASSYNKFDYDPQKAAELLDQAEWVDTNEDGIREKDGVELRLTFQTSIQSLRQKTQEQVKKDLEVIGIAVELKQIDSSIFFGPPQDTTDTRRQFYADLEEFAFSNKSPDPTAYMAGWTCDQIAQKENEWSLPNWSRYCNPKFDELFQQSTTELDQTKRAELFVEMNELLIQDVAVIPLVSLTTPVIVSKELKGYDFTAWDSNTWNIADWYK